MLNTGQEVKDLIIFIKRIITPTAYFIHCDLIDKNNNLFNGKRSDLLAKFDVTGKPYEKVRYDTSLQFPFRDCSTDSHVNSITLSVRDQDGELFDFKGMPIEFELEINKISIYTMSSNVLPSAPGLYPQLHGELNHQIQPDFRMQKVNEISASLKKEVDHYRAIAKKYKRAKKVLTGVRLAPVFFLPFSRALALVLLFPLSACRLQYRSAELVVD